MTASPTHPAPKTRAQGGWDASHSNHTVPQLAVTCNHTPPPLAHTYNKARDTRRHKRAGHVRAGRHKRTRDARLSHARLFLRRQWVKLDKHDNDDDSCAIAKTIAISNQERILTNVIPHRHNLPAMEARSATLTPSTTRLSHRLRPCRTWVEQNRGATSRRIAPTPGSATTGVGKGSPGEGGVKVAMNSDGEPARQAASANFTTPRALQRHDLRT